jgi:PAS domain S-box-containing protein
MRSLPKILVVEDEGIVAMDIQDRLAAMGYQVAGHAASGEEALALAQEKSPDLVLMDIRLQGAMDGITAAEEIRRCFHQPVIFVTAHSEDATVERAKLAEPYGYLLKPFDDRELKSTIEIALYKHRTEEEIRRLNRLYDVLSQVNQSVVRIRTREELLQTVCRLVVERGAVDLAWIGWLDPSSSRIQPVAHFGNRSEILCEAGFYADGRQEAQGTQGRAVREEKPFVWNACVSGACLYPSAHGPDRFGFQSCGSFPLRFQGEVCGTLNLCVTTPGFFREREMDLLKEVALDVSFALDKIEGEAQRNKVNRALEESEARYRRLVEQLPVITYVAALDEHSTTTFISPQVETLLGYSQDEYGRDSDLWLERLYPEDRDQVLKNVAKSHAGGGPFAAEYRMLHRNGSVRWFRDEAVIVRDDSGKPLSLQGIMLDITERKRSEEKIRELERQLRQAQKMEALGMLAGGIAHDFNNILGIILGYTELAWAGDPGDGPSRESFREVIKATHRAKELVQQILAFSRQSEQERKPLHIGSIVKEALKLLRASLPSTIHIRQDIRIRRNAGDIVMADPTQIHQVLMNLCNNAGHAMCERGGVLEVSLSDLDADAEDIASIPDLHPGPYVKLTVSDTGHGIDPGILDRIFDPYFTTKRPGEGTGLGLAVVHGIVESHGGAVTVESGPGKGSAFHVFLPAIEIEPGVVEEPVLPLPKGNETILLVDDEADLVNIGRQMLERLGYKVVTAANGTEALEAFCMNRDRFDLVITDQTMPHMKGSELAGEILRIKPHIPIILCTGFDRAITPEKAADMGIRALLMKPLGLYETASVIRRVLDVEEKAS